MAQKIIIENREWESSENHFKYCKELEKGNILFFPKIPFHFPQDEIEFLLKQKQSNAKGRKNIAYKPQIDQITNHDPSDPQATQKLHQILRSYSERVTKALSLLLSPYAKDWKHDYASFRPFQEKGRDLRVRARNDLLHVDAFPTRPMHGARILRFFTNINLTEERKWITSAPFSELAKKYAGTKQLPFPSNMKYSLSNWMQRKIKEMLKKVGFKLALRSPYDHFMLQMHNFLKENKEFQTNTLKDHWEFPPGSCWLVFTDMVSHAALSGQYALEQTFIISQKTLLYPEESPVCILERLSGKNMINPEYST